MSRGWATALVLASAALGGACSSGAPGASGAPGGSAAPSAEAPPGEDAPDRKVALVEKPAAITDGAMYVRSWQSKLASEHRATGTRRQVLIYVGASWCEPCRYFHDAVKRGELDAELPNVVLVELDRDRDEATLRDMGCISRMIPLLAVPDADGHCSERRLEGAIKGPGAVAWMTPKIRALLE